MSDDIKAVMEKINSDEVRYVDVRFTDPRGKWQHLTMDAEAWEEDFFEDGIMFDGSSIAGWKAINESDMALLPDPTTAVMDPFMAQPTMILFCDINEPSTGEGYGRDPRTTAKRASAYLNYTGLGDRAYFGPEAEFFLFDDVRFRSNRTTHSSASTILKAPTTRAPNSRPATWATVLIPRAAISRSRRSIPARTSAPK